MILDANNKGELKRLEYYDIAIIGAGTIGLYIANRIHAEKPQLNIILIESGTEVASSECNSYLSQSTGKYHYGVLDGRASGIGGTSSLWGGQLAEFDELDFENKHSLWPIGYEEIQDYYKKVYLHLGLENIKSDKQYSKYFKKLIDSNNKVEMTYTRWMKQPNFYKLYKKDVIKNKRLKFIINATANSLKFEGSKASSLQCVSANSSLFCLKASKFIFASGTIGINQFFLTSQAIGDVPWENNENVGKYFQDHLGGIIGTLNVMNESLFREFFENQWIKGIKIQPKLKFSKTNRDTQKNGVVIFFSYKSKYEDSVLRIKQFIRGVNKEKRFNDFIVFFKDLYLIRKNLIQMIYKLFFKNRVHAIIDSKQSIQINIQSEQIPFKDSQIKLVNDKKLKNGLIKVNVCWAISGDERIAIKKISKEVDNFLKENGVGNINFLKNEQSEILDDLKDTYHQCGGLIMSTSKELGVVDKDCRVWDTENVWVAGSAVFPSSSHANSTLTALALSERLVQNLVFDM
tara:strand:- start:840 stop:2390 length:1551 start_codon:yes stop_codon:yes gene_type:complete